ncbi:MAG: hypothetical protein R3C71_15750 [Candidatus Krumholzibacteriia bacterium]|nr:hypothetical protein [Candidatus Latescibacterota bacterium]
MKSLLTILLLLVTAAPAFAVSCLGSGVFLLTEDDLCFADTSIFATLTLDIELVATDRPGTLSTVSFQANDWAELVGNPNGVVVVTWDGASVTGDLASGITLSWPAGLSPTAETGLNQRYHLGTVTVFPVVEAWPAADYEVTLTDLNYTDAEGHAYDSAGYRTSYFTFNLDGAPGFCSYGFPPDADWCEWRYATPVDGSVVIGDFTFQGEAEEWNCTSLDPGAYTVSITLDGAPIGEYPGQGELQLSHLVDVSGVEPGAQFTVGVHVDWADCGAEDFTYVYTLDATIATEPRSFSAVKSLY